MAIRGARRLLLWAVLVAVLLGLLLAWYARVWSRPTPESRLRETTEELRERVRELTH